MSKPPPMDESRWDKLCGDILQAATVHAASIWDCEGNVYGQAGVDTRIPSREDMRNIALGFGEPERLLAGGLQVNGRYHVVLNATPEDIHARLSRHGILVSKLGSLLVQASYDDIPNGVTVGRVIEQLRDEGF
eukprot:m.189510 g.189510  ORF g.189510 m.189510 type:complete len:133 (+) comp18210_c0_seq4:288-686(+)